MFPPESFQRSISAESVLCLRLLSKGSVLKVCRRTEGTNRKMTDQHIERLRELIDYDEASDLCLDAVIGKVGDVAPLLSCKQVQAVCIRVDPKPRLLKRWSSKDKQRYALYFTFQIVAPSQHEG